MKELAKLNANMDMIVKNVKRMELKTMIVNIVLNTQSLKMI